MRNSQYGARINLSKTGVSKTGVSKIGASALFRVRCLWWGLGFGLCLFGTASAEPIDLRAQMSAAEFSAAGLDQLSDAQRASLNAWLSKHAGQGVKPTTTTTTFESRVEPAVKATAKTTVAPALNTAPNTATNAAPTAAKAEESSGFGDEQVATQEAELPEVAYAQIAGDFRGWDGKTLFRLTNGQVWQQRVGGRYRYRAVDPEIIIRRARFGYYLEITATGRKVGVKRLK